MRLRSHPRYSESVDLKCTLEKLCQNGTDLLPQLSSRLIFFTLVMTPLVNLHCAQDWEGQNIQGRCLVLWTLSPQTPRGGLASLCLRAFFLIPAALQTASVSSLCKSSSPSPPCIHFIVFCLRSPISLYLQGWWEQPQTSHSVCTMEGLFKLGLNLHLKHFHQIPAHISFSFARLFLKYEENCRNIVTILLIWTVIIWNNLTTRLC